MQDFNSRILRSAFGHVAIGAVAAANLARAQVSQGGLPYSFIHDMEGQPPVESMPAVDEDALRAEDRADQESGRPVPPRFGTAIDVNLGLGNAGRWTELPGGGRLWRLRIASRGAHSLNFIFDRYDLPPGGRLFIYNQVHNPTTDSTVLGAFTETNEGPDGRFSTLPIEGQVITLEYLEPATYRGETQLRLSTVVHGYRNLFDGARLGTGNPGGSSGVETKDFGDSGDCNINVNCDEGDNWQAEKRSVAMVVTDSGQRICTGALVNNVTEDLSPYFLSACHCGDTSADRTLSSSEKQTIEDWVVWFNYESSTCSDPSNEPGHDGLGVGGFKAGNSASDFLLTHLNRQPPYDYETYYAGWDATGSTPSSSVGIQHPQGDIKKISIDNDAAVSSRWDSGYLSPSGSHWKVIFDKGTVAPGASGAPLFDKGSGRIVGQLQGNLDNDGAPYCDMDRGWYGKFSMSWDRGNSKSTRLKDWLDPNSTGTTTLDGIDGPSELDVTISGPDRVLEGRSNTWDASIANGNAPYDIVEFLASKSESGGRTKCRLESTSSSPSCTMSFSDSDFQDDTCYVDVNVDESSSYSTTKKAKRISAPDEYSLEAPTPNPVRKGTQIQFALPEATEVTLVVYDAMGRVVKRLVDRGLRPGYKRVPFDANGLSSGTYFYRLRTERFTRTRHLTVVK